MVIPTQTFHIITASRFHFSWQPEGLLLWGPKLNSGTRASCYNLLTRAGVGVTKAPLNSTVRDIPDFAKRTRCEL